MRVATAQSTIDRLGRTANANGVWGYRPGSLGAAEPTALACLAMAAHGGYPAQLERARVWLAHLQRPDGGVPVSPDVTEPCWTTALAVLAWLAPAAEPARPHAVPAARGVEWLSSTYGRALPPMPEIFAHDTSLRGWPWCGPTTHSWAEPTAYAVLALRAANPHAADSPRVREAVALLLDRTLPKGGWNYGNTRVLGSTLRPFPDVTGIVLTALAGLTRDSRIEASIDYLRGAAARVRAPHSLAWALIGLHAWNDRPADADTWLQESLARRTGRPDNPLHDALWFLAESRWRLPLAANAG